MEHRSSYDVPDAVTSRAGLLGVVYNFKSAETNGWNSLTKPAFAVVGFVLLGTFSMIEWHQSERDAPLQVHTAPTRGSCA